MRISMKRTVAFAALALAASSAVGVSGASAAPPGQAPVGPAAMSPLTGSGTTTFTIDPVGGNPADPTNSYCPGDSANDNYRVQTFLTPVAVDPATLTYDVTGPVVPAAQSAQQQYTYSLFSPTQTQWINQTTAINPKGFFDGLAYPFSLDILSGLLPTGDYYAGIACTTFGVTQTFWQVPITITANGAAYAVAPTDSGPPPVVPEAPLSVLLPLTGAGLFGAFLFFRRRNAASLQAV